MKIAHVMAAFQRSPLLATMKKTKAHGMEVIALAGDDLTECATWGTPCDALPDHLAPLRASRLAGLCTVRAWQEAHVVAWADGQHAWVCEAVR
jgi:hypothetical protein